MFPTNPGQMFGSMNPAQIEKVTKLSNYLMAMMHSGQIDPNNVGDFEIVEYSTDDTVGFSIVWKKKSTI